ncbi:hypothetical protein [Steroidobacter cummioxidans]|uniref:hypothetical protein n=1 Tax=Steroidobacter cummioxidans TaxID=1803913 RepID=UPI000E314A51|nr:hypothetical protein [Steroidobacter cummioxidans]
MTQLKRDAAYIQTESRRNGSAVALSAFDEQVCNVLTTAQTVTSVAKTLEKAGLDSRDPSTDLESRVAASMLRLLHAERIELSPDS